jgi:hypothetical protein
MRIIDKERRERLAVLRALPRPPRQIRRIVVAASSPAPARESRVAASAAR